MNPARLDLLHTRIESDADALGLQNVSDVGTQVFVEFPADGCFAFDHLDANIFSR